MTISLSSESKLTDRYQTTIPEVVRKALHLHKRDKIHYIVHADGRVFMSRANENSDDPVIDRFLDFLATDISENPQQISALKSDLVERVQQLVSNVEIDLDSPLNEEDE